MFWEQNLGALESIQEHSGAVLSLYHRRFPVLHSIDSTNLTRLANSNWMHCVQQSVFADSRGISLGPSVITTYKAMQHGFHSYTQTTHVAS